MWARTKPPYPSPDPQKTTPTPIPAPPLPTPNLFVSMLEEESMSTVPSSLWASIFSWCTPAVLFVVLNFTIVTIFVTSGNKNNTDQKKNQPGSPSPSPNRFARSPSFLERIRSPNFYSYRSQEPISGFEKPANLESESHFSLFSSPEPREGPLLTRSPSMLQRLKSINLYNSFSPQKSESEAAHFKQPEKEEEKDEIEIEEEGETLGEINTKPSVITHVLRTKSDTIPASGEIPAKLPRKMRKSASTKSAFAHFKEDDIVESRRPATTRESKAKMSDEVDEEVDAKADDFINKFKQQLKLQRMDSIIRYKEMIHRGTEK